MIKRNIYILFTFTRALYYITEGIAARDRRRVCPVPVGDIANGGAGELVVSWRASNKKTLFKNSPKNKKEIYENPLTNYRL